MRRFKSLFLGFFALVVVLASFEAAAGLRDRRNAPPSCDISSTMLAGGYGADGGYSVEKKTFRHPTYKQDVVVYFPKDIKTKVPVVFFTHGYGPNIEAAYDRMIKHVVSRGSILVFGVYPMRGKMDNRYDITWKGFEQAANLYADRMDLTRVAFIGHSFGGGANPTLAYKGIVEKGWGAQGAFIMSLAPWYTHFLQNEQMAKFPKHVLHAVQVYDLDKMNDHRMAIDIHAAMRTNVNLYLSVASLTVQDCKLTAEHFLPTDRGQVAVKHFGLFRPMDILADAAFNGNMAALAKITSSPRPDYAPVSLMRNPVPAQPEDFYTFGWSGRMNPRN